MRIGIAGPITLELLKAYLPEPYGLPKNYPFSVTALLALEYIRRGHEVVVYTSSTEISSRVEAVSAPLTVCISPSSPRHRGRNFFRRDIAGLKGSMRDYPCDLVHAHWTYEFAAAALQSGIPALVTAHDAATAILFQFRDSYRLVRWMLNAYTTHRAPFLSAVSSYILATLPAQTQGRVAVIPNCISNDLADKAAPQAARGNYIVSVSNGFNRLKNLGNALLAFKEARRSLKGTMFLLVGQDCEPGGLAYRFCQENACLEDVVFVGPTPYARVLEIVSRAQLMLHPSLEESFGLAVLEAMALGTPVVAGERTGNLPNLIQSGITGQLCDVTIPESIRNAVCALLADDAHRSRIADAAQQCATSRYSASVVAAQYLDAYRLVMASQPKGLHSRLASTPFHPGVERWD